MHETPNNRIARTIFIVLTWLFAGSILLQVFFAGLALFVDSSNWLAHVSFARFFGLLPLMMIALALIARLPKKTLWRCAGLFGMIIGLFLTAIFSSQIGILSALHPLIALLLFWNCMVIIRSA
ncbi:DUF6220 domain-containing protein [Paenibacillus harenae]|uniref:DUF6220 domain-containing protein n=1 Tax=Paenibacillus harenae TaxID=306543 RepID=UPI0027D90A60|nr:DUF6220 domain-containing protein [Paenibacillus harenae]